jgi:ATP-dependent RNA helicase RhlE
LKNTYTIEVNNGQIKLDEPTDLPEGTIITLSTQISDIKSTNLTRQKISPLHENGTIKQNGKEINTKSEFSKFGLHKFLLKAINEAGYTSPTLIQDQAIIPVMQKEDLLGIAKTGSGKTASFALPIINDLIGTKPTNGTQPRVLIISPTRELAIQIGQSFDVYGKYTDINQVTIFGGVKQTGQVQQLKKKAQILIATPGRLLDLVNQGIISLEFVKTLVLDEADQMLDMGFIPDVKRIVQIVPQREQTLFFSATMPNEILKLAKSFLKQKYIHVTAENQAIPINKIKQKLYFVEKQEKLGLLEDLLTSNEITRTIVFTRTKHGADKLVRKMKHLSLDLGALHGNKSQNARQAVLADFKANRIQVLIATDIAARGLDIDDISHIINYDIPSEPETYMHRIGRTARAGKSGIAISFCSQEENKYINQIEKLLGFKVQRASF